MLEDQTSDLQVKAQEMQACVQRARDELKDTFVEGIAGAQSVMVKMDCGYEMRSLVISDAVLQEMVNVGNENRLQDLIITAVNDATNQVNNITREAMTSISRSLGFSTMG